jgi:hypothetical protein
MSRSQPWDELRYEVMSKQLITPVITDTLGEKSSVQVPASGST